MHRAAFAQAFNWVYHQPGEFQVQPHLQVLCSTWGGMQGRPGPPGSLHTRAARSDALCMKVFLVALSSQVGFRFRPPRRAWALPTWQRAGDPTPSWPTCHAHRAMDSILRCPLNMKPRARHNCGTGPLEPSTLPPRTGPSGHQDALPRFLLREGAAAAQGLLAEASGQAGQGREIRRLPCPSFWVSP